jgi:poly(3-hydroxybutyrate) depolymerase
VLAFVNAQGTAWNLNTDYPRFQRVFDQVLRERCIDTSAIFAMGHSSGAQFLAQALASRDTPFTAVAPVSSSNNGATWDPIPTLLIHGLMDLERPNDLNGAQDITQYARSNQCPGATQDINIGTCTSRQGNATVTPGCKQYTGCAATTLFCNHNDPFYADDRGNTNHGWPCFANQEIFTFLESVRNQ